MEELLAAWKSGVRLPPIAALLGVRLESYGDGRARMELDAEARHHNAMGTLHGGVLCDLADMTIGAALASLLDEGESFTTLSLATDYLRPIRAGLVTASAEVVRRGRRTALVHCRLEHDGALAAHASSTCLLLRADASEG